MITQLVSGEGLSLNQAHVSASISTLCQTLNKTQYIFVSIIQRTFITALVTSIDLTGDFF